MIYAEKIIADLINAIICGRKVLGDWSDSIIVSLFKRKWDALDCNKYCGLKLTDYDLKVIERVVENIICETDKIDLMIDCSLAFALGEAQ